VKYRLYLTKITDSSSSWISS